MKDINSRYDKSRNLTNIDAFTNVVSTNGTKSEIRYIVTQWNADNERTNLTNVVGHL